MKRLALLARLIDDVEINIPDVRVSFTPSIHNGECAVHVTRQTGGHGWGPQYHITLRGNIEYVHTALAGWLDKELDNA